MKAQKFPPADIHRLIVNLIALRKCIASHIQPYDIALNHPANSVIEQAELVLLEAKNQLLSSLKKPLTDSASILNHNAHLLALLQDDPNYNAYYETEQNLEHPSFVLYNKAINGAKSIIANSSNEMREQWQELFKVDCSGVKHHNISIKKALQM